MSLITKLNSILLHRYYLVSWQESYAFIKYIWDVSKKFLYIHFKYFLMMPVLLNCLPVLILLILYTKVIHKYWLLSYIRLFLLFYFSCMTYCIHASGNWYICLFCLFCSSGIKLFGWFIKLYFNFFHWHLIFDLGRNMDRWSTLSYLYGLKIERL